MRWFTRRKNFAFLFLSLPSLIAVQIFNANHLNAQTIPDKERSQNSNDRPASVSENKNPAEGPITEDEISLVIKGKIISVTDKEIIYKENGSAVETRMPLQNLHFLRRANGEYRFFTPAKTELKEPTKIVTEEIKPKEPPPVEKKTSFNFFITGGSVLHLAQNSDSGEYVNGLSAFIAKSQNQTNSTNSFSGQLTQDAAKLQYQVFAEPRLAYNKFAVGLNIGYAGFQKITGFVSSPNHTNTVTLNLSGYFVPAFLIFYYTLPLSASFSLNLGLGAGIMHTSVKYEENGAATRYTAWSAAGIAKPEISYKLGKVLLMLSIPFYFAESRKVEAGSAALVNGDSGKVISPNLTGISFSVAVGYQLR